MQTASIYNPQDNSLEMRVQALKETKLALSSVEACLKHIKIKGYDSVLGTKEELQQAYTISKNSYKQAVKSLSHADLAKAKDKKLLSSNEYAKLTVSNDRAKIQNARDNNKSHGKDSPSR
jgi:hypothetical protein